MNPGSLPPLDAKERERPCCLPPGVAHPQPNSAGAGSASAALGKLVLTIDQCVWHELAKKDASQHGAIGVSVSWLGEKGHDTFFRPSLLTANGNAAASNAASNEPGAVGATGTANDTHNRTNNAL